MSNLTKRLEALHRTLLLKPEVAPDLAGVIERIDEAVKLRRELAPGVTRLKREGVTEEIWTNGKKNAQLQSAIERVLGMAFDCKLFYDKEHALKFIFVGTPADVRMCLYVMDLAEIGARQAWEVEREGLEMSAARKEQARRAFYNDFANRLREHLNAVTEATRVASLITGGDTRMVTHTKRELISAYVVESPYANAREFKFRKRPTGVGAAEEVKKKSRPKAADLSNSDVALEPVVEDGELPEGTSGVAPSAV